ncbi:MAG: hypothetical protein LBM16_00260 [Clostridiales bacterium]|jgi:hypothetical protein|nr:hypothetical protein [Clostridiales bacterium]
MYFGKMNIADVLDRTSEIYSKNFVLHLLVTVVLLLAGAGAVFLGYEFVRGVSEINVNKLVEEIKDIAVLVAVVASAVFIAVSMIECINAVIFAGFFADKKNIQKSKAAKIIKELFSFIGISILRLLITATATTILLTVFMLFSGGTSGLIVSVFNFAQGMRTGLVVRVAVLAIILLITFVVSFSLSYAPFAVAIESLGLFAALRKSIRLACSRRFWSDILIYIFWLAVYAGFVVFLSSVIGLLVPKIMTGANQYLYELYNFAVHVVLAIILTLPVAPVAFVLSGVLYVRARSEEDGLDIVMRSKSLVSGGSAK